jgi:hypothetical protein
MLEMERRRIGSEVIDYIYWLKILLDFYVYKRDDELWSMQF